MPSWVNNGVSSAEPLKQRKRWEIEDKKLLKNLKYQLANDGSSDVQYDLGKQLLEDTDEVGDGSRQVQGIGYIKKAAEQGHEMALELLGACFRTGRGINAANEGDVRRFLTMSPGERSAKRAAQELFASLSGGEEFVTVEQLERRMREIYKLQNRRKRDSTDEPGPSQNGNVSIKGKEDADEDKSQSSSNSSSPARLHSTRERIMDDSNHISEANLVSAACNYSNGIIPAVNQALTISVPDPHSLDHVPCFHRPFFHPTMFFVLLYHRFITIFSSFPSDVIERFKIFILLAAYAIISTENISIFLPTVGFYVSLAVMVITSFKMLKSKHEFIDFRIWSGLFLSYDEHVNANESEGLFLRNNIKPYLWFFFSFAANLTLFPLIADQWMPHSEITVIAFVFTFVTLYSFMYTSSSMPDLLVLFSFALNVLAKYPYEIDSVVSNKWRFLDLQIPGFSTFVIGSGIEFSMNCRGVLYLLIPLFLALLARRRNWRGILQFLFPHIVTLGWLQIGIISAQSATSFGLMRATLGLAGVFLFLPLFGLVTLLIPVFAAVEWLSLTDSTNRIFVTISTSIIAIIGSCFMAISNRTGKYVTAVQILLCILASCFLFRPYMMGSEEMMYSSYLQQTADDSKVAQSERILDTLDESSVLNWELYYKYCLAGLNSNRIRTQLRCSHLDGTEIRWEGLVSDIGISNSRNWRRDLMINFMPEFISNHLVCYFGELNQANCFEGENCEIKEFVEGQKKCNVDKWNTYEYEIDVKVPAPAAKGILKLSNRQESKVVIKAEHAFGNFTQRINASDKIWFKGVLRTSLSAKTDEAVLQKTQPDDVNHRMFTRVELTAIACLHCSDKNLAPFTIRSKLKMESQLKELRRGLKYLLNVLFNPLVTFK